MIRRNSVTDDKITNKRRKLKSIDKEINRLNEEKKKIWSEIKDFRVSANKAEDGYRRMKNIDKEITDMNRSKKALERYIKDNS